MSTATSYVVRIYPQGHINQAGAGERRLNGIAENTLGELFPFHTMEELWRVFEGEAEPVCIGSDGAVRAARGNLR
jgi:hypothetical protein